MLGGDGRNRDARVPARPFEDFGIDGFSGSNAEQIGKLVRQHDAALRYGEAAAGGIVKDPYGQTKAGFTVTGKISRKEFGLTWSAVTESGGVVVGDEIKINAEVQLIKQS